MKRHSTSVNIQQATAEMLPAILAQSCDSGHSLSNTGELGLAYLLKRCKSQIRRMEAFAKQKEREEY